MLDDFELRLSYKIVGNNPSKSANSGIQYRSKHVGNWVVGGYQADFESGKTFSGILYEERGRGILARRGEKTVVSAEGKVQLVGSVGNTDELQAAIKSEDWNDYAIVAQGNHLIHKINGRVTVDVTDEQATKRARAGILALQLHAGPPMTVKFKDIRLKRLKLIGEKKIVLVAGAPSHGAGDHEHNAGVALWKHCLDQVPGVVAGAYIQCNGWPKDPTAFDNADAIVFFSDGGGGNPMIRDNRLQQLEALIKQGVGLACIHYAVEVPKDRGGAELTAWIGGYYETGFSTNPHWKADFAALPEHPITRGVRPFSMSDEWYYNIRLALDQPGFTSILKAVPPDRTRGTAAAREHPGRAEIVAWARERPDGGRGFGFTGGHFHINWGDNDCRKLLLNAILWTAKAEIPDRGVETVLAPDDLRWNLDRKNNQESVPAPWLGSVMP
jgi:type 1 glutamine amidotransferase